MKLKELLPDHDTIIQYRTHDPDNDDMLSGYAHWTGSELKPLDGDCYSVNDVIDSYKWDDGNLIVWYKSTWISG